MVILGGLEIVVGGYLIHRYHKSKNEKKRLQEEAQSRRRNTFPGGRREGCSQHRQQQQQHHQFQQHPQQQRPPTQQKYSHYAPQYPAQPQPQQPAYPQAQHPPFQRPQTAQTFPLQNQSYAHHPHASQPNPVHQYPPNPQLQIQPLNRTDSFTTVSNMPVANGSPPSDLRPSQPPRPYANSSMLALPHPQQQRPYNNSGFSVSTPNFEDNSTVYTPSQRGAARNGGAGRYTVDDNWETYSPHSPHVQFAVSGRQPGDSVAAEDGVDDAPPPYRP